MSSLEIDKIVFKPLSYQELCISLERLLRFNNPIKKFDRVCREILIKHVFSPRISLKNYHEFSFEQINFLAQLVWNESVKKLKSTVKEDYSINSYLFFEETKEFCPQQLVKKLNLAAENNYSLENISEYSQLYIKNRMLFPLNISGFLEILENEEEKNLSKNIKRIFWLNKEIKNKEISFENIYKLAEEYRKENFAQRPAKLVIIAEGITEEILLPVFSSVSGFDFEQNGVQIIASGGKSQAAKKYMEVHEELKLPVFIILDSDAKEIADEIQKVILSKDKLYLISCGEFEDILTDELVCRAVNSFYKHTGSIQKEELYIYPQKTASLAELWKNKGFGEFKKAEFAHIIAENIKSYNDLSDEMKKIVSVLKNMAE